MKKRIIIFSVLLVTAVMLSACGDSQNTVNSNNNGEDEANESTETIEIMTTLFPLEEFTNRIGGEHVNVTNIVPVGADAHTFEPTANQMIEIAESDLFIYNGADFEGFADSIKDAVDSQDVKILAASDGIDLIGFDHSHDEASHEEENNHAHENNEENNHAHESNEENSHAHETNEENNHAHESNEENNHAHENNETDTESTEHAHGEEDPHVWLDPIRSIQLAENIKDALVEINPEMEEEFTGNFEELKLELEELDDSFQQMANEITQDTIIVSHAGYGYWEERYGIKQSAISGLSSTNEPSIQQIQDVIDFMDTNKINYVMFEQSIPTDIAETVRTEVGAKELWLHNIEALTEEDVENDEDYFSLMEQNIETLRTALQ
ncbi:metal ABC transporter solute-binding protein, Zn/Mn family [Salipaludibacillus sp. CF4.18]|uniref:metal ABC transporter solute-binding protein, Zn/Mn family n=1 Tax=Salipaludibacillus sp. CF4.18 TaxID=3373081 RepID=UPI003EE6D423